MAERIFQGQQPGPGWARYTQQQAICLLQATEDEIILAADREPIAQCKQLIIMALDICRDQNLRGYPSTLDRAGRIYGRQDFDAGLFYLEEGINWAYKLSDGWFWFANLIEYAELGYRAWVETGDRAHRDQIDRYKAHVALAARRYEFRDLKGKWRLVHGHLGIRDALERENMSGLSAALENYKTGFALLARGYMGSSGAPALQDNSKNLLSCFRGFPGMCGRNG